MLAPSNIGQDLLEQSSGNILKVTSHLENVFKWASNFFYILT